MKHTPLPWVNYTAGPTMRNDYSQPFAVAQRGEANLIAGIFGDTKGGKDVAALNTAFIVRACNSHYDLLAASAGMLAFIEQLGLYGPSVIPAKLQANAEWLAEIRVLCSKAKGE